MRILTVITACLSALYLYSAEIIPADEYNEKVTLENISTLACGICICLEVNKTAGVTDPQAWKNLEHLVKKLATTLEQQKTGYIQECEHLCDEISISRKPAHVHAHLSCCLLDGIECAQCAHNKRVQYAITPTQISISLAILRADVNEATWQESVNTIKTLAARQPTPSYQEAKHKFFAIIKHAFEKQITH